MERRAPTPIRPRPKPVDEARPYASADHLGVPSLDSAFHRYIAPDRRKEDMLNRFTFLSLGLLPLTLITLSAGSPANCQTVEVVMSGLDNPRGLAFGPE